MQTSLFDQGKKPQKRLRGKFATQKQIDKDKEAKRVNLVMKQNAYLKEENEKFLRMISAMRIEIRILNERLMIR